MKFKEEQVVIFVKDIITPDKEKSPWTQYFGTSCIIKKIMGYNNIFKQTEYLIDTIGPHHNVFCLQDELVELYKFKKLHFI